MKKVFKRQRKKYGELWFTRAKIYLCATTRTANLGPILEGENRVANSWHETTD